MLINYNNHNIFAFSDTHGYHHRMQIPNEADIVICVGDAIEEISEECVSDFMGWFSSIPASLRIFVPGNHDLFFEFYPNCISVLIPENVVLLEHGVLNLKKYHSILCLQSRGCTIWRRFRKE